MAKIEPELIEAWRTRCAAWLQTHAPQLTTETLATGRDAWAVAHRVGLVTEAYADRNATDGHIQTALSKVFPAAVFRDPKRY